MPKVTCSGWCCQLSDRLAAEPTATLEREIERLVDPASATETIHWGRNYLYRARLELGTESIPVVVKQFRNHSRAARIKRRLRGSKAMLSYTMAQRLTEIGIDTPEPLMVIDSEEPSGPSFYVCRFLEGALEARYPMRAMNAEQAEEAYPGLDTERLMFDIGRLVRRLHEHGIWHRDLTSGNVLLVPAGEDPSPPSPLSITPAEGRAITNDYELHLVDLNRARRVRRLSLNRRAGELGRMPVHREVHQSAYLQGYCDPQPVRAALRRLYHFHHEAFLLRNRSKQNARGALRRLSDMLLPRRRPHAHIPEADPAADRRDKIVWDPLSDQPHQHASRLDKLRVRVADAPGHAESLWVGGLALARARRRARELAAERLVDVPVSGAGVCVRPWEEDPEALLEALDALGSRRVLLRLHPWQEEHGAEERLAEALAERGIELAFALPQNRDLVRDPEHWQASVETLAATFTPYGRHFQIGQAINRSKWGIWNHSEYVELFGRAARALRAARPDVELLGPAVIDFEPHVTAALLNLKREELHFDAVANLLYVDRRGAPEGRQLGLDTVGKVTLLQALAEGSRNCPSGRSWITEFNWPLREGPHSPAGKDVAVDEDSQADYLVRYLLLALASGRAERAYWWQLIAKGYGLIDPVEPGTLRRRPAFAALQVLTRECEDAVARTPVERGSADAVSARLVELHRPGRPDLLVGWSVEAAAVEVELQRPAVARLSRDGARESWAEGRGRVRLSASPAYFELAPAGE